MGFSTQYDTQHQSTYTTDTPPPPASPEQNEVFYYYTIEDSVKAPGTSCQSHIITLITRSDLILLEYPVSWIHSTCSS
jgi:hypothetical protein